MELLVRQVRQVRKEFKVLQDLLDQQEPLGPQELALDQLELETEMLL
jgi:hypothetical protein